jgi:hypothetical protein
MYGQNGIHTNVDPNTGQNTAQYYRTGNHPSPFSWLNPPDDPAGTVSGPPPIGGQPDPFTMPPPFPGFGGLPPAFQQPPQTDPFTPGGSWGNYPAPFAGGGTQPGGLPPIFQTGQNGSRPYPSLLGPPVHQPPQTDPYTGGDPFGGFITPMPPTWNQGH